MSGVCQRFAPSLIGGSRTGSSSASSSQSSPAWLSASFIILSISSLFNPPALVMVIGPLRALVGTVVVSRVAETTLKAAAAALQAKDV